MARNLQRPTIQRVINSLTITTTSNSAVFNMPLADSYTFTVVTSSVTGTSPTLDIVYQWSYDGGTTFVNLPWRHTQLTAATTLVMSVRLGLGVGEVASEQAAASTGGTLAKPACPGDLTQMRLSYTLGGTNPSFVLLVLLTALPAGAAPFA